MPMILPVRPYCLHAGKPLVICRNETRRSICIPTEDIRNGTRCEDKKNESPSDLKQGNVVQAGYNMFCHLLNGCRTFHGTEPKFCCAPVLFNKVQLAMILGVKVAEMSARLDEFLKLRLVI